MPHIFPAFRNFPKSCLFKTDPTAASPAEIQLHLLLCLYSDYQVFLHYSRAAAYTTFWSTKRKKKLTGHKVSCSHCSTRANQATEREIPAQIKEIRRFLSFPEAFSTEPGLISKDMAAFQHQRNFIMRILTSVERNSNRRLSKVTKAIALGL